MNAKNQKFWFLVVLIIFGLYFTLQLLSQLYIVTYVWQINFFHHIRSEREKCIEIPPSPSPSSTSEKLKIGMVMVYSESDNGEWGPELMKMVMRNKENYAKLHGYDVIIGNEVIDKTRPVAWSKILAVEKYLKNYDYIFYIDMDAVVMNPLIKLESLISYGGEDADFIMTEDWNGLNTGVWFAKNTLWSKKFLQLAWNQSQLIPPTSSTPPHGKHPFEYEQRAFHYLLNTKVWQSRKTLPRYRGEGVVISDQDSPTLDKKFEFKSDQQKHLTSSEKMLQHFSLLPQCVMNSYSLHPLDLYYDSHRDSQFVEGDFIIHFAGKKGEIKMRLLKYYLELAESNSLLIAAHPQFFSLPS